MRKGEDQVIKEAQRKQDRPASQPQPAHLIPMPIHIIMTIIFLLSLLLLFQL